MTTDPTPREAADLVEEVLTGSHAAASPGEWGVALRVLRDHARATTPGDDRSRELAERIEELLANTARGYNEDGRCWWVRDDAEAEWRLPTLTDAQYASYLASALAAPDQTEAVAANEGDDERPMTPTEKALHDAYYDGAGMSESTHDDLARQRGFNSSGELLAWVDARLGSPSASEGGDLGAAGVREVIDALRNDMGPLAGLDRETLGDRLAGSLRSILAATPPTPEGEAARKYTPVGRPSEGGLGPAPLRSPIGLPPPGATVRPDITAAPANPQAEGTGGER